MTHPPQSMVNVDARNYPAHTERRNHRLAGKNHAQVVAWPCRGGCGDTFDVGWERLLHPTFRPLCYACATKETA
ncbi:hypothetical protein SEA_CHEESETOUCH_101 [Gordonia phage CheeseTouch]